MTYKNTGYKGFGRIRQRNADTGEYTGVTKVNDPGDPDYVSPVYDPAYCEEGPLYIDTDKESYVAPTEGGSVIIQVSSNTEWEATNMPPNIATPLGGSGVNDGILNVVVEENTSSNDKNTSFKLSNPLGVSTVVTITQEAAQSNLSVDLAHSLMSGNDSCSKYTNQIEVSAYYMDGLSFESSSQLYLDPVGTNKAPSGYYSDGLYSRYWDGQYILGSPGWCQITF